MLRVKDAKTQSVDIQPETSLGSFFPRSPLNIKPTKGINGIRYSSCSKVGFNVLIYLIN